MQKILGQMIKIFTLPLANSFTKKDSNGNKYSQMGKILINYLNTILDTNVLLGKKPCQQQLKKIVFSR
jgi:hypothetical protein